MCGIGGIAFLNGHGVGDPGVVKTIIRNLSEELVSRGRDATGIAYVSLEKIAVIKHNVQAREFMYSKTHFESTERFVDGEDKEFGKLSSILIHTRAQTKGTHENRDNNHPIVSGKVIGIHNGVIQNDEDLFKDYMRAWPNIFKRKAEVDTEVIFRLLNHYIYTVSQPVYEAIKSTHRLLTGGWACAFVAASMPWMLYLFRNTSPTSVLHYTDAGIVIFASDKFSIRRAVSKLDLGRAEEIDYPRASAIAINTQSNRLSRFDIAGTVDAVGYA